MTHSIQTSSLLWRNIIPVLARTKRRDARYGLISACGAGATAAAMILERPAWPGTQIGRDHDAA